MFFLAYVYIFLSLAGIYIFDLRHIVDSKYVEDELMNAKRLILTDTDK